MVLDWNVRGLNDKDKRLAVYNKIEESNCVIICLQETKFEIFDHTFIKSFFPKIFDRFAFSPLDWCFWWDYCFVEQGNL
jgi:exonuclease III